MCCAGTTRAHRLLPGQLLLQQEGAALLAIGAGARADLDEGHCAARTTASKRSDARALGLGTKAIRQDSTGAYP